MIWSSSALRHSRVFYLRLDLHKHKLSQLFYIAAFKTIYHHYYPLYIDHPLHRQGLTLMAYFVSFFHLTHNIMIIFADCISFSRLSINALTCSVARSTQPTKNIQSQITMQTKPKLNSIVLKIPRCKSFRLISILLMQKSLWNM